MSAGPEILRELARLLGPDGLLTDAAARLVYARDASHLELGSPLAVALPDHPDQVSAVIACCADARIPVVCRGSGTGLSGGALPADGALVLGLARLRDLGPVDASARLVYTQAGVLNEQISRHASGAGLHFAPDPSSQGAATIGGNIGTNAGGPHCLLTGVTRRHIQQISYVDAQGRAWVSGRGVAWERGLDLASLLCGSEGTLGVVTGALVRLQPDPAAEATILAFFPRLVDATAAVVRLLGSGLLPVAVEIVDKPMLEAIEQAFAFGFPTDVEAALIVEFSGLDEAVAVDARSVEKLLAAGGANQIRRAADAVERLELWKCRKKAFGAVGRLAPSYVTMDVVVPLGELPELVQDIHAIGDRFGVEIATAFHAGDGNLHPGVHYDDRDPQQVRRAQAAADAIMHAALGRGGSISGEHGVGVEKLHAVPWQLDKTTARLLHRIKECFDPNGLLNPGKVHPDPEAGYAEPAPVPRQTVFAWDSLTVTAPASASLGAIQAEALARGFWIPLGLLPARGIAGGRGLGAQATVGEFVENLGVGPALLAGGVVRDFLLEYWGETGTGEIFHTGAPVFKNVIGYGLAAALCGSGRLLAKTLAATFQLRPLPDALAIWRLKGGGSQDPDALLALLDQLLAWNHGLAGPTCIFDPADPAAGWSLTILLAARDTSWDLDQKHAAIQAGPWASELELVLHRRWPFGQAAKVLAEEFLPLWALDQPDWCQLSPLPEARLRPGWQAEPAQLGRAIWQGTPWGWWVPTVEAVLADWHADVFSRNGQVTEVAAPGPGVDLGLLRRLKEACDPDSRLTCPSWLPAGNGGSAPSGGGSG